jgi:DUF2075 family protein
MIIYAATKDNFRSDIIRNQIEDKISAMFQLKLGRRVAPNEIQSWRNSLMYMSNVIDDNEIPNDSLVALEYKIPQTSKRIDFMIAGKDSEKRDSLVIVELKQWTEIGKTDMDAIVTTFLGRGKREEPHPSYQAWSYASLLKDYNAAIQDKNIGLFPCAYLHNCGENTDVRNEFYNYHLEKAPVFLRRDSMKLTEFIKKHIKYGDKNEILYQIDNGKIRPSKNLADSLSSMLQGNKEFIMIDDQKLVFEKAMDLAKQSSAKNKNTLIVEGGPGSGKSVVAINLLVQLTGLEKVVQYVTKNAAPRAVYEKLLTGDFRRTHISNLFVGSGRFIDCEKNSFDVLVVDEAHRLNEKSGLFGNLGENQTHEIIKSSLFNVFFIDENQKVTFKDIGTKEEIKKWAKKEGSTIHELKLSSQFRCSGSNSYIAWLDNALQIEETANLNFDEVGHEFKVFGNPSEMFTFIHEKNKERNKARLVAGYCWDWKSKKNFNEYDITIGSDFKMKWNLSSYGSSWIIQPNSVNEIGCIHTCQGLELDYIGVIIGPDLVVRDLKVVTDPFKRSTMDQSIKGFRRKLTQNKEETLRKTDEIIKNTYRILMTRGTKGCYIYCTDPETNQYFKTLTQLKVL